MWKTNNSYIAVEESKSTKKRDDSFLASVESTQSEGYVFILPEGYEGKLKINMKVLIGPKREPVTINGKKLNVMEESNILLYEEESTDEQK